jgi:hypothetical protein
MGVAWLHENKSRLPVTINARGVILPKEIFTARLFLSQLYYREKRRMENRD